MTHWIGIDLGSAHVGIARADSMVAPYGAQAHTFHFVACGEHGPLAKCGALCPHLHREIGRCVDWIAPLLVSAERVIVEYQGWFPSPGNVGRSVGTQQAWTVGFALVMALVPRCAAPMEGMPRQRWACRLVPHQQSVSDADIAAAMTRELGAEAAELRDVHQRDAFGALLGWMRQPAPKPPRAPRAPAKPRPKRSQVGVKRSRGWLDRRSAARAEARAAIGCTCRWTRPQRDCAAWDSYHAARQGISKGAARA